MLQQRALLMSVARGPLISSYWLITQTQGVQGIRQRRYGLSPQAAKLLQDPALGLRASALVLSPALA